MLSHHIALVPEAGGVNASELARVCAALQKQLTRDLAPIWKINATINAFPHLEDVPLGYWPIIITFCELGDQAGVHIDKNGQPYAQVEMAPGWSFHASQACLDMLVNPFARRLVAGPSPRPDQGPVEFLIEIGAPCSDPDCAYVIDDVLVSDFCTPAFWGSSSQAQHSFSFTGALRAAHEVPRGGHLTWHDPVTDKWWLRHHLDQSLVDTRLGKLDGRSGVVREAMRLRAPHALRAEKMSVAALEERLGVRRQHSLQASQFQAHRLRSLVASSDAVLGHELEGGRLLDGRGADQARNVPLVTRSGAFGARHKPPADDVAVEVMPNELLDETQAFAELQKTQSSPARSASQVSTRSVPPPLPDAHRSEAQAPQRHEQIQPVPILQTPIPQAPLPRAAPLPPPRVPERTPVSVSTVPPISVAHPSIVTPRAPMDGWLLAASMMAGAATVVLAIVLYGRGVQSNEPSVPRAAAAPISTPVAVPTQASPPAPPVAAQPAIPAAAAPAPLPPATPAAPAPTAAPTAPPVAQVTAPPVVLAPAAPQPARIARPRVAAPPAAPAPAPAPRPAPKPADDSDPLEGLIGERR